MVSQSLFAMKPQRIERDCWSIYLSPLFPALCVNRPVSVSYHIARRVTAPRRGPRRGAATNRDGEPHQFTLLEERVILPGTKTLEPYLVSPMYICQVQVHLSKNT